MKNKLLYAKDIISQKIKQRSISKEEGLKVFREDASQLGHENEKDIFYILARHFSHGGSLKKSVTPQTFPLMASVRRVVPLKQRAIFIAHKPLPEAS